MEGPLDTEDCDTDFSVYDDDQLTRSLVIRHEWSFSASTENCALSLGLSAKKLGALHRSCTNLAEAQRETNRMLGLVADIAVASNTNCLSIINREGDRGLRSEVTKHTKRSRPVTERKKENKPPEEVVEVMDLETQLDDREIVSVTANSREKALEIIAMEQAFMNAPNDYG